MGPGRTSQAWYFHTLAYAMAVCRSSTYSVTFHNLYFQWYTWAEILGVSSGGGAYVVKYLLYLICGCFFALLAAMFVRVFAPYACGSGIPEVSICTSVII